MVQETTSSFGGSTGETPGPDLFLRTMMTVDDWSTYQQQQAERKAEQVAEAAARTAAFRKWEVRSPTYSASISKVAKYLPIA